MPSSKPKSSTLVFKIIGNVVTYGAAAAGIMTFLFAFVYPDRFGDVVSAIRGSGEQVTKSVEKVTKAVESLQDVTEESKRETSNDPVKELVNRGYALDNQSFWKAAHAGDRKAISLFCESGGARFVEISRLYFASHSDYRQRLSEDLWSVVLNCPIMRVDKACSTVPYLHPTSFEQRFDKEGFKRVCGAHAVNELEDNLEKALDKDLEFLRGLCADYAKNPALGQARFQNERLTNPARHRFGKARFNVGSLCSEVAKY